jgi:primosomal protein DnaI
MRTRTNTQEIAKPKYNEWTCDNRQEIIDHINSKHSIYLWGAVGTGKTHMLHYAANQYNNMGCLVFLIMSSKIHDELIREIKHNQATGEMLVSVTTKMKDADVLFLDDLGNEKMTDYYHEALSSVIDYRYRNKLPTFVTSNYNMGDLYEVWEQKIGRIKTLQLTDRLRTFGVVEIISKNWRNEE